MINKNFKFYVLTLLMLISCFSIVIASEVDDANLLASRWIITNYATDTTKYRLWDTITRKETMKIIMKLSWLEVNDNCSWYFKDVVKDWWCKYIESALNNWFIAQNDTFRPNDNITKSEIIKLILKWKWIDNIQDTVNWQNDYMETAYAKKIITNKFYDYNTDVKRWWLFTVANAVIKTGSTSIVWKCGDWVCDDKEKADSKLCPKDCEKNNTSYETWIVNTTYSWSIGAPYYFIAIHNEPAHCISNQREIIAENFEILKKMINKADEYNIKLTMMFTAQWADYISQSSERMALLKNWQKSWHEISAHHHWVYHGNWDGYSGYSEAEAVKFREDRVAWGRLKEAEDYIGDLDDYTNKLELLDWDIVSGCVNEETDKTELPDSIIYPTCSGFSNHLWVWVREDDGWHPEKWINKYVTVWVYNWIERKWLAHAQITSSEKEFNAESTIESVWDDEVYGAVVHSTSKEYDSFVDFLDFMHQKDPTGAKSRTVTNIIKEKILPEERIDDSLLEEIYYKKWSSSSSGTTTKWKCWDWICGIFESRDQYLCPSDCQY